MEEGETDRAAAFAPEHVTGLFAPSLDARDPRGRGSIGAGIVLDIGVRAYARCLPSRAPRFRLTSNEGRRLEISEEAGRRLLGRRRAFLDVRLSHSLPIGQGFGSSAAGATATALVVARLLGRTRRDAVQTAHLADLYGRGGLGGVSAILGGGLEVRRMPGIPPFGKIDHSPLSGSLLVGTVGRAIPSPSVLSSPQALDRIRRAAAGLDRLGRHPTVEEFFRASERFTDEVGLASPGLRSVLRALRRRGSWAAQAMFGQSFFCRPRTPAARVAVLRYLWNQGLPAVEVGAARRGAHLLAEGSGSWSEQPPPRARFP